MELYYIMCNASGNTTALIKSPLSRELYVTAAFLRSLTWTAVSGWAEESVARLFA